MLNELVEAVEAARDNVVNAVRDQPTEVAPPIATPHIGGPMGAWISCLQSLRPVLADLARELEAIDLEAIVDPHHLVTRPH